VIWRSNDREHTDKKVPNKNADSSCTTLGGIVNREGRTRSLTFGLLCVRPRAKRTESQ
jgi:hypothetical protein